MDCYKVESDFTHDGLRCVVIFQKYGHRCGYVAVPSSHPLFKKDHSAKFMNSDDIMHDEFGKRSVLALVEYLFSRQHKLISPALYFNVHGGITFSGATKDYPVPASDVWWFGFDCAHAGDARDLDTAVAYGMLSETDVKGLRMSALSTPDASRWDLTDVEAECRDLAAQLNAWAKKKEARHVRSV